MQLAQRYGRVFGCDPLTLLDREPWQLEWAEALLDSWIADSKQARKP